MIQKIQYFANIWHSFSPLMTLLTPFSIVRFSIQYDPEAALQGCSYEKMVRKYVANLQQNINAEV